MKTRFQSIGGRTDGFTLVELMISMVLGLIVIGGVVSVLLSNKQSYRTNEGLSQIQEGARTAFELLARDVRQTGIAGCYNMTRLGNVLKDQGSRWWDTWFGIEGFDGTEVDSAVGFGTAAGTRVNGTDSMRLQGMQGLPVSVDIHQPGATAANFKITEPTSDLATGDIAMVCDFDHATIFQVTNYVSATKTVVHNAGSGSLVPGNCSKGLGFPSDCGTTNGNSYTFPPNSQIAKLVAVDWYIGNNGRAVEGGRSLYRQRSGNGVPPEEIVAGVTDMQIQYRVASATTFVGANTISAANWANVNAIMVTLTLNSTDQRISTDVAVNSGRLQRTFTNILALRNRVP